MNKADRRAMDLSLKIHGSCVHQVRVKLLHSRAVKREFYTTATILHVSLQFISFFSHRGVKKKVEKNGRGSGMITLS